VLRGTSQDFSVHEYVTAANVFCNFWGSAVKRILHKADGGWEKESK